MSIRSQQLLSGRKPEWNRSLLLVVVTGLVSIAACQNNGIREDSAPETPVAQGTPIPSPKPSQEVVAKPRTDEYAAERAEMVALQIEARGVKDARVLAAMHSVPRHWFVPGSLHHIAYSDRPLPIGEKQTISQPYIVALMTEALRLTPSSRVLEIGTGSGYQAAVLSEITPHVFTIEIVEPLARQAIGTFGERGYTTIRARIGDGYDGWPEQSPFDAIIVTCAPDQIPPKLIEQLKPGGRICIPVGSEFAVQRLVVVTKTDTGALKQKELIPVRFVPMTGTAQREPPGN